MTGAVRLRRLSTRLSSLRPGGPLSFAAGCTDHPATHMNDLLISLLVFALIFGGALLGVVVRPLLSEHHLHPDSRDVVKMATGLIGTLTAIVLGLLIASAKSTFDQKPTRSGK
jgi:hypothetical protein